MAGAKENTDTFVAAVAALVEREGIIPPGAGVVVGVSGGADSVALLAVLRDLATRPGAGWRLTVAHLNHRLRPEADEDEQFVAELAARWQIPLVRERCDVRDEARRTGEGLEQAARTVRYDFLLRAADQNRATRVALGHHADDNVETVLYRVIRGTHLRGMGGIPVSRPLGPANVRVVRPMLGLRRTEIEAFCRRRRLAWRTDTTNADTDIRRNFIRHELLPLLRERLNPGADEALLRLGAASAAADEHLAAEAQRALGKAGLSGSPTDAPIVLDRCALTGLDPIIRAYAMRIALERAGLAMRELGADRLDELSRLIDPDGPPAVSLPGNWRARREGDRIVLAPAAEADAKPDWTVAIECPGRTMLPDGRYVLCETQDIDRRSFERHCRGARDGVELLDADRVCGPLLAHPRRPGDVFLPLGAPGRQTVSDFLTNCRLDPRLRDEVVCIADDSGIVYLSPLRIDDRVKITPDTSRVLRITLAGE